LVKVITKIRVHEAIAVECRVDFGNALDQGALPDIKTCQKFSGETEVKQEGGSMKNQMASLRLEK